LDKAQTTEKLLTVFTGPIFREDDPSYGKGRTGGPWKIPLSFWKIAVLQKTPTKIAAAAFIVGQTQYVQALYEAKVFSGLSPTPSMKGENAKSRRPSKQSKRKPVLIFSCASVRCARNAGVDPTDKVDQRSERYRDLI